MKVIFVDRDGTIIREPSDEQVDSLEKLEFIPGSITGLRKLIDRGYALVMVTNQDGLGSPAFPTENFERVHNKMLRLLEGEGIRFTDIFICPHLPNDHCECRKPKTTLLADFLNRYPVELERSYVLGDRMTDVELAKNIGCRSVLLRTNAIDSAVSGTTKPDYETADFSDACSYILRHDRRCVVRRKTNETEISVEVNIDGSGGYSIRTGVGFFDHMLAQIARHASFDLTITVEGDLGVDEHHTVEDTGLALGECIAKALGDKRGIDRYGFVLPMDESLAYVTIDLGGRPYFVFEGSFTRERVGEFPTELVEDFFRALADGLRANLHIQVKGRNDHHKIEAIFKGIARALKQAVTIDEKRELTVPSTKGIL
jgi:imidazoleglycerol-phosphate dehydratase / histidinol-phosphatase